MRTRTLSRRAWTSIGEAGGLLKTASEMGWTYFRYVLFEKQRNCFSHSYQIYFDPFSPNIVENHQIRCDLRNFHFFGNEREFYNSNSMESIFCHKNSIWRSNIAKKQSQTIIFTLNKQPLQAKPGSMFSIGGSSSAANGMYCSIQRCSW